MYAAIEIAFDAHDGQRLQIGRALRRPLPPRVAGILADQHMDHETVIAGLLHDTVEDTDAVTFESIEDRFGSTPCPLVEGETKVSKVGRQARRVTMSKQGAELTPECGEGGGGERPGG